MKHLIFSLLLLTILFISCEKYEKRDGYISDVEGPSTGKKSEKIPFTFSAGTGGSCSSIGDIKDSKKGKEITITIEIKTSLGPCTADFRTEEAIYEFCERKAGIYLLKFKSYDGFIEREIVVQ